MMCDVSNKSVTTSGNMSNTVNHCQSSHMWSDSIVKEQKTGDLFSEYTLMCRRTELPCLYFFFFWQSIFIKKLLIFPVWWLCLSDRFRCDGCCTNMSFMSWEHQTAFTLARGIRGGVPGDLSLSLFVYKLLPGPTVSWCLGGNNNSLRLYYSPTLCTANGFWLYCHIWDDTPAELMT